MLNTALATVMTENAIKANNNYTSKVAKNSNKMNEALARTTNKQKGLQKDTFVTAAGTAATIGATVAVKNSKKAQKVLTQSFKPIKKAFCESNFGKEVIKSCKDVAGVVKPALQDGAKWVKNLPKPAKAILGIGPAVTALASTIVQTKTRMNDTEIAKDYAKKEAQIEQQYK